VLAITKNTNLSFAGTDLLEKGAGLNASRIAKSNCTLNFYLPRNPDHGFHLIAAKIDHRSE